MKNDKTAPTKAMNQFFLACTPRLRAPKTLVGVTRLLTTEFNRLMIFNKLPPYCEANHSGAGLEDFSAFALNFPGEEFGPNSDKNLRAPSNLHSISFREKIKTIS
ncbi:hypothetical protein [Cupriavidus sp. AcVe19-1a]|uniref:hypothetical protein n=1 Tax=Cupriavidus sp. AcVe19-1a TaxID=2821359 RepID=UPI001AEB7302|nr:hypothetical protein [Cupriavidus sp. AcVe19-1a]MBP0628120.1 hypothetical protein [Cupriavidus sp. AcVe19-1a]